jgi:hypothetical protein
MMVCESDPRVLAAISKPQLRGYRVGLYVHPERCGQVLPTQVRCAYHVEERIARAIE